jgi:flagella basal body P-ring formation protein FlgA
VNRRFAAILCFVWGGFFFTAGAGALPQALPSAEAYGMTQEQRYPQTLAPSYFTDLAKAQVQKALDEAGEKRTARIEVAREPSAMRLPSGTVISEVKLPSGLHYEGSTPVHVLVYVDGSLYRRAVVYVRLTVRDTVLVAARDLRPEESLDASAVRLAEVRVSSAGEAYLRNISEVAGRVSSRFLREGTPLTPAVLLSPRVLEVGMPVTIIYDTGGIEVKTEGTAMQRGRIGERVRVKNNRSGKILNATVKDAQTVTVS